MNTLNKLFGIEYRDGYYWTGLYYKGNDSKVGSKTLAGILAIIFDGRY